MQCLKIIQKGKFKIKNYGPIKNGLFEKFGWIDINKNPKIWSKYFMDAYGFIFDYLSEFLMEMTNVVSVMQFRNISD